MLRYDTSHLAVTLLQEIPADSLEAVYMTDSVAVLEDSYSEVVNVIALALKCQLFSPT